MAQMTPPVVPEFISPYVKHETPAVRAYGYKPFEVPAPQIPPWYADRSAVAAVIVGGVLIAIAVAAGAWLILSS
jgi:hypothetical protein